jgi:hypothetical protein
VAFGFGLRTLSSERPYRNLDPGQPARTDMEQPSPAADSVQSPPMSDRLSAILRTHVNALLAELANAGVVPQPDVASGRGTGWTVLLLVLPNSPGQRMPPLTACDRDCLAVLGRAKEPLSAARVRRALKDGTLGVRRRWGLATVKRSLARLKADGWIRNSRTGRRGYYLETLPLFQPPAG